MKEIRFLMREDLTYAEGDIKEILKISSVSLERGFLAYDNDNSAQCVLIIRDEKERRYKVHTTTRWIYCDGEALLYPYQVWTWVSYKKNFAFSPEQEAEIFDTFINGYKHKVIDADTFITFAQIANTSRKELVQRVVQHYSNLASGLVGMITGLVAGRISYDMSEMTKYPFREYVDFWPYVLTMGLIFGFFGSSIPATISSLRILEEKKENRKKLIEQAESIDSKLKQKNVL